MPPRWTRMPGRRRTTVRVVRVDLQRRVVNGRQPRGHRRSRRDRVVLILIELPQAGQRAEGHVELAAGPVAHLAGDGQHLDRLGAHRHRRLARGRVQARDVAALLPDAQQRVETIELGKDGFEGRDRGGLVGRVGGELRATTPSRAAPATPGPAARRHRRDRGEADPRRPMPRAATMAMTQDGDPASHGPARSRGSATGGRRRRAP